MKAQFGSFDLNVGGHRFDHLPQIELDRCAPFHAMRELQKLPDQLVHRVEIAANSVDEVRARVLVEQLDGQAQAGQGRSKVV